MNTAYKPIALALAGLGLVAATAGAATLATPALEVDPDGRLACTVINVSRRAFDMGALIVDVAGENVTDFASTSWTDDGRLAAVVVESSADGARSCVIDVGTNRKNAVRAYLEAFDAAGVRTAVVEAR